MRLTARQHLRRTADFEAVRALGLRADTAAFSLQIRPSSAPPRRLGVIASRRVGGAVQRNRAKRLLREAFRLHQDALPPACDVVLVARSHILGLGGLEVQQIFRKAAERLSRRLDPQKDA